MQRDVTITISIILYWEPDFPNEKSTVAYA